MMGATSSSYFRASPAMVMIMAVGCVLTLSAGYVYGRFTHRWGPQADLEQAARHLDSFPQQLGDWELAEENPLDDSVVRMLSCAGYVSSTYRHRESNEVISIALIVGPPGPTSVHTPEICYSSQSYDTSGARDVVNLSDPDGTKHSFWHLEVKSRSVRASDLSVYYAWSAGPVWQASDSPRLSFAGAPLLYKIQIAGARQVQSQKPEPVRDFLRSLLESDWRLAEPPSQPR